jgi:hypothetical protein
MWMLMDGADGSLLAFHFHHHQVVVICHYLTDNTITCIFPLDVGGNLEGFTFHIHL